MQRRSAEAYVLDVVDLHDRDRIVTFFGERCGRKRGVTRGARTKFSRFAGQLQLLARVVVRWFEKEGRELVRIESAELVRPVRGLFDDLDGILLGSYLADHLMHFVQEDEESPELFRLLESSLAWLEEGVDRDVVARYFEVWVLRLAGIFPSPRECPVCGGELEGQAVWLSHPTAEILCGRCPAPAGGRSRVSNAAVGLLREAGRTTPPRLGHVDRRVLREVEAVTSRVRCTFLQHELRSYEVMKATLGGSALPA